MATSITADDMLAALRKWGITPKFYRDNWRTWNRNAQQGWGPLRGVVIHNFGSSGSDTNQLAYLYRGDGPTSSKPGPLSQFAVTDDGQLWIIGWGTATHAGAGDPKAEAKARANTLPLTSEHAPTTIGTDAGTVKINPHYLGVEQCHGAEGPTPAQRATTVRWAAAMLDMLGGPAEGYGAGSVLMHRELTRNRSDPQGIPRDGVLRREIAAVLQVGVAPVVVAPKPPVTAPTPTAPPEDDMPTVKEVWQTDGIVPAPDAGTTNPFWAPASYLRETFRLLRTARAEQAAQSAALLKAIESLAGGQPIDLDAITAAAQKGASEALATLDATVTLAPGKPTA